MIIRTYPAYLYKYPNDQPKPETLSTKPNKDKQINKQRQDKKTTH